MAEDQLFYVGQKALIEKNGKIFGAIWLNEEKSL
jgi:hypothetical protein